jgi:hypothetical protein
MVNKNINQNLSTYQYHTIDVVLYRKYKTSKKTKGILETKEG